MLLYVLHQLLSRRKYEHLHAAAAAALTLF
jgi:hypothetical protein